MPKFNSDIFNDTKVAFIAYNDEKLKKAYKLFRMMNINFLNSFGTAMLSFFNKIKLPINSIAGKFLFQHFCASDSLENSLELVDELYKHGVKSVLDYSAESKEDPKFYEFIKKEVVKSIDISKENNEKIPFAVFKMTAIFSTKILEKKQRKEELTKEEEESYNNSKNILDELCKYSKDKKVPILIDAERISLQKIIDELVYEMMEKYNKEKAIVYNTIQFYRKDSVDNLKNAYNKLSDSVFLGIKLVRGAYLEEENKIAKKQNKESPIHDTKENTDKSYDEGVSFCIEHIDRISMFMGTHNANSVLHLMNLIEENNLDLNDDRIYFSQLYGMSENISFNIAKMGYNVSKYIPYGPISLVTPYLIRRARENKSMRGHTGRELSLIKSEMQRRKLI